jgi:peptidoglycan/LPS O-acetylase OafA/YrhL
MFNKLSKAPSLVLIGGMCYTLYLFHLGAFHFIVPLFMDILGAVDYPFALAACFCVVIPLTILLCSAIYFLIEKPTMDARWPRKLLHFIVGQGRRKKTNASQ